MYCCPYMCTIYHFVTTFLVALIFPKRYTYFFLWIDLNYLMKVVSGSFSIFPLVLEIYSFKSPMFSSTKVLNFLRWKSYSDNVLVHELFRNYIDKLNMRNARDTMFSSTNTVKFSIN